MTCKDCIHECVCDRELLNFEFYCGDFKDKSKVIELPCKVGDTIMALRGTAGNLHWLTDKVTSVLYNNKGWTVKTKSVFYPIKESDGYTIEPISTFPNSLGDYYVGDLEEAERVLKE